MFSLLRNRFGIPGIVAVFALVFAMAGGALAAKKYIITSTNQIKPSVLKSLQGKAGPAGAAGAKGDAGPAGPQGPAGKNGTNGTNGATGVTGAIGTTGATGATGSGATGATGATGNIGATLTSSASETGTWGFGKQGAGTVIVPISFNIPLLAALDENHVHFIKTNGKEVFFNISLPGLEEKTSTTCLGNAEAPTATSGNLCIYQKSLTAAETPVSNGNIWKAGGAGFGDATAGSYMEITATGAGAFGIGTWAVKAP